MDEQSNAIACPQCGLPLSAEDTFCPNCNTAFDTDEQFANEAIEQLNTDGSEPEGAENRSFAFEDIDFGPTDDELA